MKWLIVPIDELKQFDPNWETRRKSIDETKAIIHEEAYNELMPPVMTLALVEASEPVYPFPIIDTPELDSILNSAEWSSPIDYENI